MRSELGLKRIQNFIMSDTEELHVRDFNPSTYEHVLPEGAHDFDDYDSDYAEQHPELGFTDEQVEAEVAKTRSFMKSTASSWILITASMVKSSRCRT